MNDTVKSNNNMCGDCGAENPVSSNFCSECGQKIEVEEVKDNICFNCGFTNDVTAKFCGKCGHDLSVKKLNETSSFEDPVKSRSVSERKGLTHKLLSDAKKEAKKAKDDLKKSIEDYTLDLNIDIRETEDSFIVSVELPNVKKEDINLDIAPRNVNIKALFDHEVEVTQGTQIKRVEVRKGQLNKNIPLKKNIIPEQTVAEFESHILTLKLIKEKVGSAHSMKL